MPIKPTKRKAFNFLRSYFDVLNELDKDKDKLDFLLSIINKQFLNENPKGLNFLVNLCYESQRHQIESSVKGWERASKDTLSTTPSTPYTTTPSTPCKEEEEKEKEEEKEEVFTDIDNLISRYLKDKRLCNAFINNKANNIKNKQHLKERLTEFKTNLIEQGRYSESWEEFTKYFRNWNKVVKQKKVIKSNHKKIAF